MRTDDPRRVRMLLDRTLLESHLGLGVAFRVDARSAEAKPDPPLVHEIREVQLRSLAQQIAREMRVLRRAHQALFTPSTDLYQLPLRGAAMDLRNRCRPEIPRTVTRENPVAGADGLD